MFTLAKYDARVKIKINQILALPLKLSFKIKKLLG